MLCQKYHGINDYWILYYIRRKSEKVQRATEIAAKYQKREGRQKIRVKVIMTPFGGVFEFVTLSLFKKTMMVCDIK